MLVSSIACPSPPVPPPPLHEFQITGTRRGSARCVHSEIECHAATASPKPSSPFHRSAASGST